MKITTQAVLLSALVFPGAGHLMLKRYISAVLLAGLALTAIYRLASIAMDRAWQIVEKIQIGEIPADITVITEAVLSDSNNLQAPAANTFTAILIVSWLVGIADAYRVGRAEEQIPKEASSQ